MTRSPWPRVRLVSSLALAFLLLDAFLPTVLAGDITSTTTSASSLIAGATGVTYTFGFSTANSWAKGELLSIGFPSGYGVAGAGAGSFSGCSGASLALDSVNAATRTVNVRRTNAGSTSCATGITVGITGITNPVTAGATGTFRLETFSGATSLDVGAAPSVTLTAAAATKLAFTVQPTNVAVNAAITPAVRVSVQDANSNTVRSSNAAITLALASNPGSASLTGTLTVNAISGVATFSDLALTQAGTGYTLSAASTGLAGATSAAFDVVVAFQVAFHPVLATGDADTGAAWGAWTADPAAQNVVSNNFLKITNTGGNPAQSFTIDFDAASFVGAPDAIHTIALDGNIEFSCKEGTSLQTPAELLFPAFTRTASPDGAITLQFTASANVYYCKYQALDLPSILPDQSYTATFTVT